MTKHYIGDVGLVITLDCGIDVSTATVREIAVRKPDGTEETWAAVASGTNGIAFTTLADTLDQAGEWRLQSKVTLPAGPLPLGETTRELVVSELFE